MANKGIWYLVSNPIDSVLADVRINELVLDEQSRWAIERHRDVGGRRGDECSRAQIGSLLAEVQDHEGAGPVPNADSHAGRIQIKSQMIGGKLFEALIDQSWENDVPPPPGLDGQLYEARNALFDSLKVASLQLHADNPNRGIGCGPNFYLPEGTP